MATNVKLDDDDGTWLTLEAVTINSIAADFRLDNPERRGNEGGRYRRALVHDVGDQLTINFAGDYPGGVRINHASVNLAPTKQRGEAPKLPKEATVGDLVFIENSIPGVRIGGNLLREAQKVHSLWICVGKARNIGFTAVWRQISLGDEVWGEE